VNVRNQFNFYLLSRDRGTISKEINVKTVTKIAMLGAVLAFGVTAASAQTRNWNSGPRTGSFYGDYGPEYTYGYPAMRDHNNYGVSREYIWATPQNDGYNPGGS